MREGRVNEHLMQIGGPGDVLAAIMSYLQASYPIKTFPPAYHPAWKELVCRIIEDPDLRGLFSRDFNIGFELDDVTMLDPETERIWVDPEDQRGKLLGKSFPSIAERIFEIALETRDFIQLG